MIFLHYAYKEYNINYPNYFDIKFSFVRISIINCTRNIIIYIQYEYMIGIILTCSTYTYISIMTYNNNVHITIEETSIQYREL